VRCSDKYEVGYTDALEQVKL